MVSMMPLNRNELDGIRNSYLTEISVVFPL